MVDQIWNWPAFARTEVLASCGEVSPTRLGREGGKP